MRARNSVLIALAFTTSAGAAVGKPHLQPLTQISAFGSTLLTGPESTIFIRNDGARMESVALGSPGQRDQPGSPTVGASSHSEQIVAAEGKEGLLSAKLSDVLLVVFTALLALFTLLLWKSTAALAREAEKGGRTADQAAKAAEASARAAEHNAEIAARVDDARLVVSSMSIQERFDYGDKSEYLIVATLTNCGRTPAEVTHTAFYAWLAPTFEPVTENLSAHTLPCIKFGTIIEPGKTVDVETEIDLTESEANALCDGSTTLWAWGAVSYRTYFDRSMAKGFVGKLDHRSVGDNTGAPARARVEGSLRPPPLRLVQHCTGTVPDPDGQAFGLAR